MGTHTHWCMHTEAHRHRGAHADTDGCMHTHAHVHKCTGAHTYTGVHMATVLVFCI